MNAILENCEFITSKLSDASDKLEKAIENEDFKEAERLQSLIDAIINNMCLEDVDFVM